MNRRTILCAASAAAILPAAPVLAIADTDPDAELHRLIAEYRRLDAEEDRIGLADLTRDPPNLTRGLLPVIEALEPQTMRGALAKLRLGFDDDEIESGLRNGGYLDRVGYAALTDLFRITGEAQS